MVDQKNLNMKRICKICHKNQSIKNFYKDRKTYKYACKKCYHFSNGRGINGTDYNRIYNLQDGKCKICDKKTKLIVDHNHKTGNIRGLICNRCNLSLGFIEATKERLFRIILYLQRKPYKIMYWNKKNMVR